MKRKDWLYKYAIHCVRGYKPYKVYNPIIVYLSMYILLLLITKGLYQFSLMVIGFTIGIVIGRYLYKKFNQFKIIWAIFYSAKYYIIEDCGLPVKIGNKYVDIDPDLKRVV